MVQRDLRQTGRDHYTQVYDQELRDEARWLEYGAVSKADSVEWLLERRNIHPKTVLEIGCGTGAILRELHRRGIGRDLYGIDYSESAIAYAQSQSPQIGYFAGDVTEPNLPVPEEHFDLIVISHVLEHLEEPDRILRAIGALSFGVMVAEVPLENLAAGRVKALMRNQRMNRAGHVQFFDENTFRGVLNSCGFRIDAERRYANVLSLESLQFDADRNHFSGFRRGLARWTSHHLPRHFPLWSRFYYAHYAALCTKIQG